MKNIKRVLWIIDYFPRPHDMSSGTWALETVLAIKKQGVDVVVLSPTPWIPKYLAFTSTLRKWSTVPNETLIDNLRIVYPKCPHYPHRFVRKHIYNRLPFLDTSLVWPWCKKTTQNIFDQFNPQVVHSNFIFPSGFIGLQIKRMYKIPLIVHERGTQRLNIAKNHLLRRKAYIKVISRADRIITPNNAMGDSIKELLPDKRKLDIVRDVGDVKKADILKQQKPGKYKDRRIILSVGTLTKRKGYEYLIRAIDNIRNEFQDIQCIIIGSGILQKHLTSLVNKLELKDVIEFYGRRTHNEVLEVMSWCDVFVLPSWDEAFGTVYSEAMTFAKPIIACQGEGISEVVQDGVHGILVKKQDITSLSEALRRILSNEKLSANLGRAARSLAERELNLDVIANQLITLYEHVIL